VYDVGAGAIRTHHRLCKIPRYQQLHRARTERYLSVEQTGAFKIVCHMGHQLASWEGGRESGPVDFRKFSTRVVQDELCCSPNTWKPE